MFNMFVCIWLLCLLFFYHATLGWHECFTHSFFLKDECTLTSRLSLPCTYPDVYSKNVGVYFALWLLFAFYRDIPRIPESSHPPLESSKCWYEQLYWLCVISSDFWLWKQLLGRNSLFTPQIVLSFHIWLLIVLWFYHETCCSLQPSAGSSSFESQKMDRPSISVMSPTSPGTLRDLPMVLPGQLSVSTCMSTDRGLCE